MKYEYPATWLGPADVHDGDTFYLTVTKSVDIGFHLIVDFYARQKFRLARVNCPELSVKPAGEDARQYTIDWLTAHKDDLYVTSLRADKFGDRWDAEVFTSAGENLSDALLKSGHAKKYRS